MAKSVSPGRGFWRGWFRRPGLIFRGMVMGVILGLIIGFYIYGYTDTGCDSSAKAFALQEVDTSDGCIFSDGLVNFVKGLIFSICGLVCLTPLLLFAIGAVAVGPKRSIERLVVGDEPRSKKEPPVLQPIRTPAVQTAPSVEWGSISGRTITVTVPAGFQPGQRIQIKAPDGRLFLVTIPVGMQPGSQFQVNIA